MQSDTLMFAQVMTVIVASVASFVAIGLGARVLWRMGSHAKPAAITPATDARLERLEQAVEAIAIETERISEGQRFTVALLSERLPSRAGERIPELPGARTHKTPH